MPTPSAKTCSPACRQAVYRARRKAAAELEAARQDAERVAKWERMLIEARRRTAKRKAAARQAEREAEEDDLDSPDQLPPESRPRRRKPRRCLFKCGICERCLGRSPTETVTAKIVITVPTRFPGTPLNRGR